VDSERRQTETEGQTSERWFRQPRELGQPRASRWSIVRPRYCDTFCSRCSPGVGVSDQADLSGSSAEAETTIAPPDRSTQMVDHRCRPASRCNEESRKSVPRNFKACRLVGARLVQQAGSDSIRSSQGTALTAGNTTTETTSTDAQRPGECTDFGVCATDTEPPRRTAMADEAWRRR
jgi:hypothetical protein